MIINTVKISALSVMGLASTLGLFASEDVIPGWSDLGSFDALSDEVGQPQEGNGVLGAQSPLFFGSKNNLVVGGKRKIAMIDVEDLIVIDTPDALLLVKKGSSQKVKDVVAELKKNASALLE